MEKYHIKIDKIANNIIGFKIECKGYTREYPAYMCDELTLWTDFMSEKIGEFLTEIKNYPKIKNKLSI